MLAIDPHVFAVVRASDDAVNRVLALTNVSAGSRTIEVPLTDIGSTSAGWRDVLSRRRLHATGGRLSIALKPYDVVWLVPEEAPPWIVVTDLDGTLLDEETYDWTPARPAIDALAARGIPLLLCTSKSRAELEPLRAALGHEGPFIVENGGAVCVPAGLFGPTTGPPAGSQRRDGLDILPLGTPYATLVAALAEAAAEAGIAVRGFHDMDDHEVAERTGLTRDAASLARRREFDEAFIAPGVSDEGLLRLERALESRAVRMARGGRFLHVLGQCDKGLALRRLLERYMRARGPMRVAALGDAPNDLPILNAAHVPIIIRSPRASTLQALVPRARISELTGPAGWNAAVLALLAADA